VLSSTATPFSTRRRLLGAAAHGRGVIDFNPTPRATCRWRPSNVTKSRSPSSSAMATWLMAAQPRHIVLGGRWPGERSPVNRVRRYLGVPWSVTTTSPSCSTSFRFATPA
jgi:hypothetical protein